jgi:RNA-directed DNA polymerase
MSTDKGFVIPKHQFVEAWRRVKSNAGSSGIDLVSISMFEKDLKNNLYKLWNRMSSGSYFPPNVKAVAIPKKSGGERVLGIPTVGDRVAQMVVKLQIEQEMESLFLSDSYGYRPGKSAHGAVQITRERCWKYSWLVEFDIVGLFDNLSHALLMKAVHKHVKEKWCTIAIERWLKAGLQSEGGEANERTSGTPQGGVISPLLSNLFLHYAFDRWITKEHSNIPWCRYADDGLLHCKTRKQAEFMLNQISKRFEKCQLSLHPIKTRIVSCRPGNRGERRENVKFEFLGFEFKQRSTISREGQRFRSFLPGVGEATLARMKRVIKWEWKIRLRSDFELKEIATQINPVIRGWINYYGKFYGSEMRKLGRYLDEELARWLSRKHLRLRLTRGTVFRWLRKINKSSPKLFAHWEKWKLA